MSEEIKGVVVDAVKSTMEDYAKADAVAEVAKAVEAIEVPSVDGFAKSEELEHFAKADDVAALTEKLADLQATLEAAPAITGEKSMDAPFLNFVEKAEFGAGHGRADLALEFDKFHAQKAVGGTGSGTQLAGSATGMEALYHQLQQMNPMRQHSAMLSISGGAVNLPQLTSITAAAETSVPNNSPTGTPGGTIANVAVVPKNWVSRNQFSDAAVADFPSLDATAASFIMQALARAEASDMVTTMDAATVTEVNTGVAAGLPSGIAAWSNLIAAIDSAYLPNAKFIVSRQAWASLRVLSQSGTGSPVVIDPSSGMMSFYGYNVVINDHLDAGNAAGQNPAYFGDFSRGTVIVERKGATISRHEDTVPGAVYYYGNMRSQGTVWDANALVRFNVAA